MSLKIRHQLIASTPYSFGRNNQRKFITIHETGNPNRGADAAAHANLQTNGNSRDAAWHWQVDDKEAVQSFTHDQQLWHAGDGNGDGNNHSIGIEICIDEGGDWEQAKRNAIELTTMLMRDENVTLDRVVQHNHWSGKNCPTRLRADDGTEWRAFVSALRGKPTPPAPGGSSHTVVRGDTLSEIAVRYGTTWQVLQQINQIADPNIIHAGQQIKLPAATTSSSYTVVKGDTLHGIAQRHGTTWQELQRVNGIIDANVIHPGLVLRLP